MKEFDLYFTQKENVVWIKVTHPSFPDKPFWFSHDTGNEIFASLLYDKLSNTYHDQLEDIRKLEYESGWKDAKAKSKKRNWFYRTLIKCVPK